MVQKLQTRPAQSVGQMGWSIRMAAKLAKIADMQLVDKKIKKCLTNDSICIILESQPTKKEKEMVDNNNTVDNGNSEEAFEERIVSYIKSLAAIEEAMEPFKEQKRALKGNYIENGWLTRDDISMAVKAFRMVKDNTDPEQLMDYYNTVKTIKQ